jgi:hypothetical protein
MCGEMICPKCKLSLLTKWQSHDKHAPNYATYCACHGRDWILFFLERISYVCNL